MRGPGRGAPLGGRRARFRGGFLGGGKTFLADRGGSGAQRRSCFSRPACVRPAVEVPLRRVLLLNASYEPMTTLGLRRAGCLVPRDKADGRHADVSASFLHAAPLARARAPLLSLRRDVRVAPRLPR